jgi:ketose-bisphosphate aldolase
MREYRGAPPPGAVTLNELLPAAQAAGYAVPAFSPRYLALVRPVVEAAIEQRSPFIVEISQRELGWFDLTPEAFRDEVARVVDELDVDVPYALHLDHTWDDDLLHRAMEAGFTSVMIDASTEPFATNIVRTARIVEEAHERGISVESELGRLTTTERFAVEGGPDTYTDPEEAGAFVRRTGCDALAVSVGTAHGAYPASGPTIDFDRLARIRREVGDTPLVLHGGSGLPAVIVHRAVGLAGGGIAKMNIATDLEQALLTELGGDRRRSAELDAGDPDQLAPALARVRQVACDKIALLRSGGRA